MRGARAVGQQAKPGRWLVFVSHSSRDTWVARQIARVIEEHGAQTFLDANDIQVGDDFAMVILDQLRRADELVILWTPWALESQFVLLEVGAAWGRGIPISQILYGVTAADLASRPSFPTPLKGRNMIRIDDLEVYLEQLRERATGSRRSARRLSHGGA